MIETKHRQVFPQLPKWSFFSRIHHEFFEKNLNSKVFDERVTSSVYCVCVDQFQCYLHVGAVFICAENDACVLSAPYYLLSKLLTSDKTHHIHLELQGN